ncbi:MAG: DsrE family protein [Bacteroidetes bacterium]|nr:DsrE family protein [Bacteroidota bacterium]
MKSNLIILSICFAINSFSTAQSLNMLNDKKGDPARAKIISDSLRLVKLHTIAQYPLIKGGIWSGVLPVENPGDKPDPSLDYKLVFKVTAKNPDSISKEISRSLDEVARILNLHVAAGIPASKLHPVIVIQGAALESVMNNDAFKKNHSFDNPNISLISDLEKAGAKFISCGQSMAFQEIKRENLLPDVKVAMSARTAISGYQAQGYVLYTIEP